MRRAALLLAGLGAVAPAAAHAGAPAPPAAPAPQPAPAPAPGPTALALKVERAGPLRTVVAGTRVRLRITAPAYAPGQRVTVRVLRRGRKLSARAVTLQAGPAGTARSVLGLRVADAGRLTLRASAGGVASPARTLEVLPRRAGSRSAPGAVRALQRALRSAGYVVGRRGSFDARTARAVLAFRKVSGMARTTAASTDVMHRLARGGGRFRARYPRHGRHVEGDLSLQVIALIGASGRVERIYPASSGSPATPTVHGMFKVYRKDPGTNALGMVHSSYFIGGYAIHGYHSVPTFPASHGCLRVPVPDALSIFRWVRHGTRVDVYG